MYQNQGFSGQQYNQFYNQPYLQQQRFQTLGQQQFQQPYVQQTNQMIYGKIVNAQENITANDVPMDGNTAFFPKSDMSEIYAKSWNANDGSINTVVYKPFCDNEVKNVSDKDLKSKFDLSEESRDNILNHIDERIDKLEKLLSQKRNSTRLKKEGETE